MTKTDGYLCFHDTGPTPTAEFQTVPCSHLGQYVIIYNKRNESGNNAAGYSPEALVELCNVEIYGKWTCLFVFVYKWDILSFPLFLFRTVFRYIILLFP